ncbi:MAG: hypothetical protein J2P24_15085 [Streptosporangiales bacterium]|nr:hypothetical protein [Streptosporangiales bacterium]
MTETGESQSQQLARNTAELLQELRVAQAGVQILFAFLLAVAFTTPFGHTTDFQRFVYGATMMCTTGAVAAFTAPVAWHRLLFRQRRRPEIVRIGNVVAVIGLALLATALTGVVLLVFDVVFGHVLAGVMSGLSAVAFVLLWFLLPMPFRRRADD